MSILQWIFGEQPPDAIKAADRLLDDRHPPKEHRREQVAPETATRSTCIVGDDVVHARAEQAIALSLKLAEVPGDVWPASMPTRRRIASYIQYTQVRCADEIARQRGAAQ
jgi:hypothetical protein